MMVFSGEESNIISVKFWFFILYSIHVNCIGVTSHLQTIIERWNLSVILIDVQDLSESNSRLIVRHAGKHAIHL
jgi:hypothetical protein